VPNFTAISWIDCTPASIAAAKSPFRRQSPAGQGTYSPNQELIWSGRATYAQASAVGARGSRVRACVPRWFAALQTPAVYHHHVLLYDDNLLFLIRTPLDAFCALVLDDSAAQCLPAGKSRKSTASLIYRHDSRKQEIHERVYYQQTTHPRSVITASGRKRGGSFRAVDPMGTSG
jgi:hypothetical protein